MKFEWIIFKLLILYKCDTINKIIIRYDYETIFTFFLLAAKFYLKREDDEHESSLSICIEGTSVFL